MNINTITKIIIFVFIFSFLFVGCQKHTDSTDSTSNVETVDDLGIPELSSDCKYIVTDFEVLKIRMNNRFVAGDSWKEVAVSLFKLQNIGSVDFYYLCDVNSYVGVENNEIIIFGTNESSSVKDLISDEALLVEPAIFYIHNEQRIELVWKTQNGYIVIESYEHDNIKWYDRTAYKYCEVKDLDYLSFITQ